MEETAVAADAPKTGLDRHGSSPAARVLGAGEQLGRYCVLSVLGSGAMGVVYAAYDPELDRRVAIKVIQPAHASEEGHGRLLREAQALARLSHPNVVAVHDVGTHTGWVFVAMEFVAGRTLAELELDALDWAEIVAIYRAAGRGLEAAHLAGLVHRDFKPANVMRREDGRVVVMDFGLARSSEAADAAAERGEAPVQLPPAVPGSSLTASSSSTFDAHLTRTGSLLGTPAYMAPEQFAGAPADARSDQFAFCVALWEALFGERPFRGSSFAELAHSVTQHEITAPSSDREVPGAIRTALLRGLAAAPDERWPDIGALLDELSVDPAGRRRTLVGIVGAIALLGAVAVGAYVLGGERRVAATAPVCTGAEDQLAEVWTEARRAELERHLAGLPVGYAKTTATRVDAALDDYTGEWIAAHTEACEATRVRGEQSEQILDLRMACLDRRKHELSSLIEVFGQADVAILSRALAAVGGLSPISTCSDLDALSSVAPPPATGEVRARVDEVRRAIARARALWLAAKYDEALALLDTAEAQPPPEYPPVAAEYGHIRGNVLNRLTRFDEAETVLREAQLTALRSRDLSTAGHVATSLSFVVGYVRGDYDRGLDYADQAIALAEATGDEKLRANALGQKGIIFHGQSKLDRAIPLYEASIEALPRGGQNYELDLAGRLYNLALARRDVGLREEALAELERALELYADLFGPGHPDVLDTRDSIATTLFQLGRFDEAEAVLEDVLAARGEALGHDHFDQFSTLTTLGNLSWERGENQRSIHWHTKALELAERALGPEHPNVATALRNLGHVAVAEQRLAEAEQLFERSLKLREAAFGDDSVRVADGIVDLALIHELRGEHEQALALLDRADAVIERSGGRGTQSEGGALLLRGQILRDLGRSEQAEARLRAALDVMRSDRGQRSGLAAGAALELAELLRDTGELDEAIELAAYALSVREEIGVAPAALAEARLALARALAERGDDPARVRELGQAALAGYEAAGRTEQVAEIRSWLAGR